jgi:hypothetical protein
MGIDPRRLSAIHHQIDALAHETDSSNDPELHAAFNEAKEAIRKSHKLLSDRGKYLKAPAQHYKFDFALPPGYDFPPPPKGKKGS